MFAGVVEVVREAVTALEPGSIPLPGAEAAWRQLDEVERLAAGAKLRLAARVEEAGTWRRAGRRSAADHLALLAGTSVGQARGVLEASRALPALPEVEAAVTAGVLSAPQAHVVADAAAVAPAAQRALVDAAARESLSELRERCGRTKAAADRDAEATYRRIHAARFLRTRSCGDGAAELQYRSTPDEVAEIAAVVDRFADRLFRAAHREGRAEPSEAHRADALLAVARRAAGPAPAAGSCSASVDPIDRADKADKADRGGRVVPKEVVVRVDWDALVRGWPVEDEVCEIPGVGSVPVGVVRAMVESGDAVLKAVATRGVDVVNVAHLGRRPSAHQRTALRWLDLICVEPGCGQRAFLEIDHTVPWATTRLTLLELLEPRCRHHHRAKTRTDLVAIAAHRDRTGPAP